MFKISKNFYVPLMSELFHQKVNNNPYALRSALNNQITFFNVKTIF